MTRRTSPVNGMTWPQRLETMEGTMGKEKKLPKRRDKPAGKSAGKGRAGLSEKELEKVSGGLNPQPLPPGYADKYKPQT